MSHTGGCHCGAVRFTATLPADPVPALACNCSICAKTGFLHIIVPHADFTLERGDELLTGYRFGTGAAEHLFCSRCGVKSFYRPRSHPDAYSINAHCLDQVPALAISPFDGRNWAEARAALDEAEATG